MMGFLVLSGHREGKMRKEAREEGESSLFDERVHDVPGMNFPKITWPPGGT